jgi:hypothetical protein
LTLIRETKNAYIIFAETFLEKYVEEGLWKVYVMETNTYEMTLTLDSGQ